MGEVYIGWGIVSHMWHEYGFFDGGIPELQVVWTGIPTELHNIYIRLHNPSERSQFWLILKFTATNRIGFQTPFGWNISHLGAKVRCRGVISYL